MAGEEIEILLMTYLIINWVNIYNCNAYHSLMSSMVSAITDFRKHVICIGG